MIYLMGQAEFPGWIFGVAGLIGLWKVFEKAGREGWEALIPFYNLLILWKIVGKPGWWLVFFFIPVVNIVCYIYLNILLAKSFRQEGWFTVGLVLLNPVFLFLLGIDERYQYQGPAGADPQEDEYV